MLHNAAFHQGLHCMLGQSQSSEKEIHLLKIITCEPSMCTMLHPDFIACSFVLKRVNGLSKPLLYQIYLEIPSSEEE